MWASLVAKPVVGKQRVFQRCLALWLVYGNGPRNRVLEHFLPQFWKNGCSRTHSLSQNAELGQSQRSRIPNRGRKVGNSISSSPSNSPELNICSSLEPTLTGKSYLDRKVGPSVGRPLSASRVPLGSPSSSCVHGDHVKTPSQPWDAFEHNSPQVRDPAPSWGWLGFSML